MNKKIGNDEAKRIMLDILLSFANYCDDNCLRYYLAYGTLIGAVRHKGFIPWDNDIDVWMPRPDYERFRLLAKNNIIGNDIKVLDFKEENTFPFLKVINSRTLLKEHYLVTENNLGLYIDVFPLDALPSDKRQLHNIQNKAYRLNKLFSFANYRLGTGKNILMKIIKFMLYPVSRLMSSYEICKQLDELCSKYKFDECERVGNIIWGDTYKEKLDKVWFESSIGEFEGYKFSIPKGYDDILKLYYGEYMQLPPEDKRITHYYDAVWKD